jgi:hypothetical protein
MPHALLPMSALLRREQLTMLRGSRPYFFMMCLVAFTGGAVALFLAIAPPEAFRLDRLGEACESLFYACTIAVYVGVSLLVPLLAATSVVLEIQDETFEMLTLTDVRPIQFLAAKFIGGCVYALLLTAAIAPIAALSYFGVGLDVELLTETLFVAVALALQAAAAGILAGCLSRKTSSAVVFAYVFYFSVAVPVVVLVAPGSILRVSLFADHAVRIAIVLLVTLLFLLVAYIRARSRWHSVDSWERQSVFTRPLQTRHRVGAGRRFQSIADNVNPVYLLEARFGTRIFGLTGMRLGFWSYFLYSGIFLLTTIYVYASDRNNGRVDYTVLNWIGVVSVIGAPLLVPAFIASIFTREAERNTLNGLAMTTLTTREIVVGKLSIAFWIGFRLATSYAVTLTACVLIASPVFGKYEHLWPQVPQGAFVTMISLLLFLVLASVISVCASLLARRSGTSLALAYASLVFLTCVVGPFVGSIISILESSPVIRLRAFWNVPDAIVRATFSPVYGLGYLLNDMSNWRISYVPYMWSHLGTAVVIVVLAAFCFWRYRRWVREALAR